MKYTRQAIAVAKRHRAVSSIFAMYLTYLKNAVSHILQKESSPQFDRLDALL
jgi:hypothetical protein